MNWKLKFLLFAVLIAAIGVFVKLPSQAGINVKSAAKPVAAPVVNGEFTEYENGIIGIAPHAFAISKPVKDLPTADPDALVNRANFVSTEQRREQRAKDELKDTGVDADAAENEEKAIEINKQNEERIKTIIPGAGAGAGTGKFKDPFADRERKSSFAPPTMPTPSLTFPGASQIDNAAQGVGAVVPPDPNGDIGPSHYVSAVNAVFKVFDKDSVDEKGVAVAGPVKINSLFQNLPAGDPCRETNDGDPIVLYDSLADRWHISQFGMPTTETTNYQCVALSVTGDPTGAYYVWSYAYPGGLFNDYPKVGVWTDGYHMTFNQFTSLDVLRGLGILTQDRKKALVGDPTTSVVYKNVGAQDPKSGGALPGDIDGFTAPPEGLAEVIGEFRAVEFGDPVDGIRLYKWAPDFTNPSNSVFTVLPDLKLEDFDAREPRGTLQDIEQAGGAKLDSVSDRSMHRFAYRNLKTANGQENSYVGNFTVNVSGEEPTSAATYQAGIRWFEVRRTNDAFSVFDEGTHNLAAGNGATGLNNWMGAIAQDNKGNIALGFSQAGTTQNADIKIAGRTGNSQHVLNEGEAMFWDATGSQIVNANPDPDSPEKNSRWGDYSSMNVDPTDDCTFWYTQEYYETLSTSGWSTRVGRFKFPQCTPAPKATIRGTVTFCENRQPVNGASVDATGGFNRVTDANGTYTMTVAPGTYRIEAGRSGGLVSDPPKLVTIPAGQSVPVTIDFCLIGPAIVLTSNVNPQISSESCGTTRNNLPDPGEEITVSLPLQNTGAISTRNLTATLQPTDDVINPSAAQNYGAIAPGIASVSKDFTFKVNPNLQCGSNVTLTFIIKDGSIEYGTVTKTYRTGVLQPTLAEKFDSVTAPALPAGWTNVQIGVGTGIKWVTSTASPNSPPNTAFANNSLTVNAAALVSPSTLIQTDSARLSFKNFYDTEVGGDGMVLEYSIDDGSNWRDITADGGSFVSGGYTNIISTQYESPIGGRRAWTGKSNSFIDTVVNLPPTLKDQNVRFRWLMASDNSIIVERGGVRVDDVQILGKRECASCAPAAVCQASQTKPRYDFDGAADSTGKRKSDISVFRPSDNIWYLRNDSGGFTGVPFGTSSDKLVPADYDGDGKTDLAVYREGVREGVPVGFWFIQYSGGSRDYFFVPFGDPTDIPQPADFDGDGRAELAVFRPSNGGWYTYNLANGALNSIQFGALGDKPVVGDFDGDCKADYAVFRPSNGTWYVQRSRDGFLPQQFGLSGDKPVPADYDGDGKTDIAVFRPTPANGTWYLLQSKNGFTGVGFGFGTDLPVPADYDGDGKADIAVWRPSNGFWYLLQSVNGFKALQFGASEDKPIPNVYVQ